MFAFTSEIFVLIFFLLPVRVFYPPKEDPLTISHKTRLVVGNSFYLCLAVKLFISSSVLNDNLAGYSILAWRFFSSSTLNVSCHSLLAHRVSAEKSACTPYGASPAHCFSLAALCLIFDILIIMCFGVDLLGFILFRAVCFLDLDVYFLP